MVKTMEPFVVNVNYEEKMAEIGSHNMPGTDYAKSLIAVPFNIREDSVGLMVIQDFGKENAFSDLDLNLLTTLAASMSVALENALYLTRPTKEQAELAIINSVQQALASQLDFQEVINLVGDKLREVFNTQDIGIRIYDSKTDLIQYLYEYEHGERLEIESGPPRGITAEVIRTRQPVVINEDIEKRMVELGSSVFPGTDAAKSLVAVPILVGDEVIGTIQHENFERENAISDADLRLLNTLTSSMSVALDNARLFNEINRLLEEFSSAGLNWRSSTACRRDWQRN